MLMQFEKDNNYQLIEYACHEGNYAMGDILSGARAGDTEDAKRKRDSAQH